ncbi:hypothetical protein E0K89_003560 [Aquicoccus sp. SCR17]|nr:hypothetical protein [Carideicomes alvinocaridis]
MPEENLPEEKKKFFVVTFLHLDFERWKAELQPHVDYLKARVADGSLVASGPAFGLPGSGPGTRAGLLIIRGRDRAEIEEWIAADPFARHDLIDACTITEWDPVFGAFADQSSGGLTVEPD